MEVANLRVFFNHLAKYFGKSGQDPISLTDRSHYMLQMIESQQIRLDWFLKPSPPGLLLDLEWHCEQGLRANPSLNI